MRGLSFPTLLAGLVAGLILAGHAVAQAGTAELRVVPERRVVSVGETLEVRVEISRVDAVWAGYSIQVSYDADILEVVSVEPGGIAGCEGDSWGNPENVPNVVTGCAFQTSTETGVAERITMRCEAPGRSVLHLVTLQEDAARGSTVFDENAVNIETHLVDSEVTCSLEAAPPTVTQESAGGNAQGSAPGTTAGHEVEVGGANADGTASGNLPGVVAGSPRSGEGNGRFVTSVGFVVPAAAIAALAVIGLAFGLRRRQRREHR